MPHHRRSLWVAVSLVLAGCAAAPAARAQGVQPAPAKRPPGYHPAKPMPIDAALQASARQLIETALRSPDELVRAHALEVIGDVAYPDAAARLLPALDDPSPLVRKAAAMSVGRLKLAAAHDRLLRLATAPQPTADPADPNQPVYAYQAHMAAVFALHQLGDTRYSHEFELSAHDPRAQIRGDTALILELIGNTSAAPLLVDMLKHDRSENVRLQAAEALWRMGDERGENFLIPATLSGYASDCIVALLALAGPRDRRALGHVQGFLTYDDHPEVALAAARAAGELGSDAGVGVAEIGAKNGDPVQRSLAALALGDIGRTDAQPVLRTLLSDDEPEVRLAAAAALLEIGGRR